MSHRTGYWGTTPGLSFVYAHLDRTIVRRAATTVMGRATPAAREDVRLPIHATP